MLSQRQQSRLLCNGWSSFCESVLLAAAIRKRGNEDDVLKLYKSAQGRRKVMELLTGAAPVSLKGPVESAAGLLAYWRDESGHGIASSFSEFEAHDAMARLLRLAQFASSNWDALNRDEEPASTQPFSSSPPWSGRRASYPPNVTATCAWAARKRRGQRQRKSPAERHRQPR